MTHEMADAARCSELLIKAVWGIVLRQHQFPDSTSNYVWPPNVLWNSEIRNVVLIDFEHSEILKQVPVLQDTSPNRKRKYLHLDPDTSCQSLSVGLFINLSKYFDGNNPCL